MAARDIAIKDVLPGLLCTVLINDSTPTEIIQISNVKTEDVVITEEPENITVPTVSVGVERNKTRSYKTTIQFDIDENETDLITAVRALDDDDKGEIIMTTSEGGDNGNGKILTMTSCDRSDAYLIEGHKTRFVFEKKVAKGTLAYTNTHVAA